MSETIRIIKRNGEAEPLDISKINKVVSYSCENVSGVSASEIIKQASLMFNDGMSTERIQEILIKAANELITPETPQYAKPAARLNLYDVRKRVFHDHAVPTVYEHVKNLVEKGVYHETLLQYSEEDFEIFEEAIDHDRDDDFSTAAVGQLTDKYLLRNRAKGSRSFYETPQFMYMAIAMTLFSEYPASSKRTQDIVDFYEGASTFKFSLPTPIMGGARTPTRQFSSCVLINCGDTLDSINATATAITNYVSKKAGIGVAHGSIRAEGAPIRNGEMVHTGVIPFLKYHVGALKSCSQGGIRGGSATFYYPWWHLQIEEILVLKNNKGTYENRERRADYGINFNRKIFTEFLNGGDIYLFSPEQVKSLEHAFYTGDNDLFEREYEKCVELAKRGEIRYKKIPASMLIHEFVEQRSETGRIYAKFTDNVNRQSPFDQNKHPIHSSNLCFTGDTMVATADGRNMVSIKELAESTGDSEKFPVFSARATKSNNSRKNWVDEVKSALAFKTASNAEVVEVKLSNGTSFKCTPDHLIALRSGGYVAAKDSVGSTLAGFYTSICENKYRMINATMKSDERFPSSFSKNRFGGSTKNLWRCVEQGFLDEEFKSFSADFNPPKSTHSLEEATTDPIVISVDPAGREDVYDLNVEGNHNFYIITNNDPKNSLGVLVHNCAEIALPTKPLQDQYDENGRIALCTLSSFNMLEFADAVNNEQQRSELFKKARTVIRSLDGLLAYQDYPMIQAKISTEEFRSLGVGVVNLASFLAYHGFKYGSPEANKLLNQWFELFALALTEASCELAEELGPCTKWKETCYGMGLFPHQQHPSSLFELDGVEPERHYEEQWTKLMARISRSGIRNATLSAIAPTESSSQVLNATNGVEMPTSPVAIKGSKSGNFKQPVPLESSKYQYVWDQKDCGPYLHTMAVIQRWIDQSISTNTFYSPELWGGTIPRSVIIRHILEFYSLGGKTLYYSKMPDGATDSDEDQEPQPPKPDDEECDSCHV